MLPTVAATAKTRVIDSDPIAGIGYRNWSQTPICLCKSERGFAHARVLLLSDAVRGSTHRLCRVPAGPLIFHGGRNAHARGACGRGCGWRADHLLGVQAIPRITQETGRMSPGRIVQIASLTDSARHSMVVGYLRA